jgi:hypothetical protein
LFSTEYKNFSLNLARNAREVAPGTSREILKYTVLVYLTVTIREKEEPFAF